MQLSAIEGNTQRLDGGSMFGNAPKAMWEKWIEPDNLNRIPLACRSLLVQIDGQNILFDVGVGAFFDPKMKERFGVIESEHLLLKNLEEKGIGEEEIDVVILSHLHFDHVGGILSSYKEGEEPRLLFPRAKYYTGQEHWNRASSPHYRDRASFIPKIQQLLQESGRLSLIEGNSHPDLEFGVTFSYSDGHTPGLLLSTLHLIDGPLLFVADLAPGLPWVHLPITMGYDRYPELLINEKKEHFEKLIEQNGKLFFTHDPNVPCVKLKQNEKGRFYGEEIEMERIGHRVNLL